MQEESLGFIENAILEIEVNNMIRQDLSTYPSINGTIIYTLIYSISKEVKEANDEVVKPVRSAPLYEENFLR
ncbi:MAG: hypothetical protein LUQ22_01515, partial [Methanotrichaceae archaeon]|nr:hypothetical protein [Methanotrichaceae archaeon]